MKRTDAFKSDYFKSAHVADGPITVTIANCELTQLPGDDDEKPVLSFSDHDMKLILNATNWDAISDLYGDDSDGWKGKKIILYQDTTRFQGKTVDCIRVRGVESAKARPKSAATDPNGPVEIIDEVPF